MNFKKIIVKIKSLFGKKAPGEKRAITLDKIWKIELVLAAILLSAFLAFDFWMYQNFVLSPPDVSFDRENVVPFRKLTIERTVKKIEGYTDFLEHPTYPFVENPF